MARVVGIDPKLADSYSRPILEAQARKWGGPLLNHLVYARRPSIFRGVSAMWAGLHTSGLIEEKFKALINLRVAAINHCEF
jgi:hypothetical protein